MRVTGTRMEAAAIAATKSQTSPRRCVTSRLIFVCSGMGARSSRLKPRGSKAEIEALAAAVHLGRGTTGEDLLAQGKPAAQTLRRGSWWTRPTAAGEWSAGAAEISALI